jgi:LDH2 family malate/lactate/ureidoglycolate dehydrogenase
MAFMVEILGGALTGSRCGYNVPGGWGSVFTLIDPNILRPIDEFKNDVESLINEVKTSPKMKGFAEIYFPGEKSQKERRNNIEAGEFELSDKIYEEINNLLSS